MMYSEVEKDLRMNTRHVPFWQSDVEVWLEKEEEEEFVDESSRNEGEELKTVSTNQWE